MCVCVCVCVCVYTYIYMYMYVYIYICIFHEYDLHMTSSVRFNAHTHSHTRSSYIHTNKHAYVCVYICFWFVHLIWVCVTAIWLSLCYSSVQLSLFERKPAVGSGIRHIFWAFIAQVTLRVTWLLTEYCTGAKVLNDYLCACVNVYAYECICQMFYLLRTFVAHAYHLTIVYASIVTRGRRCTDWQTDAVNGWAKYSTSTRTRTCRAHS